MARVLVVDDQSANSELMAYLLEAFGHEVLTAADGAEGLVVARRERPDLLLVDVQMPVMSGPELVAALRLDPDLAAIPVVGVTALAWSGDRERVLAAGFAGYMAKPIQPATFVHEIEAFLSPELREKSRP